MMSKRELLEFRTPQHPSFGTNNWGGASPLLARDLPKESLEQRYLKLNSVRTHDEIFPSADDQFKYYFETDEASKYESQSSKNRRGLLWKLIFGKKKEVTLGSNSKKKRWFPRWDPKNRWPQGWC